MRNNAEKETYVALLEREMVAQGWKCSYEFNTDSVTLSNLLGIIQMANSSIHVPIRVIYLGKDSFEAKHSFSETLDPMN